MIPTHPAANGRIPILVTVLAGGILAAWSHRAAANDAPEYLTVRAPIADTLEAVPSTTGDIGVTPESWTAKREGFPLRTVVLMERLREKYYPKTGIHFIDDAVFTVSPRIYHRYQDLGADSGTEATAAGGAMSFESGWIADRLRVNLVGYTSQKLYGPGDRDGSGLLRPGQESYTVFGEAFGELRLGRDTSLFAGRVPVDQPFINGNDSRMTPNTFRAVGLRTLAVPDLKLGLGHVDRIRFRADSEFVPMSVQAGAPGTDEGVSAIGARYDFAEDLYLGVVNQYGWNLFNTLYVETESLFDLVGDLQLRVGGQFTDQRSIGDALVGDFQTRSAGVKAALGFRGFILSTSYVTTANGGEIRNPWGGSPSYHSSMISDFDRAGEDSWKVGLSYDLGHLGLKGVAASAAWVRGDTPESGAAASADQQEFNTTLDWRPDVELLENVWFRVRYAINDRDQVESRDFRVILNYAYSF